MKPGAIIEATHPIGGPFVARVVRVWRQRTSRSKFDPHHVIAREYDAEAGTYREARAVPIASIRRVRPYRKLLTVAK